MSKIGKDLIKGMEEALAHTKGDDTVVRLTEVLPVQHPHTRALIKIALLGKKKRGRKAYEIAMNALNWHIIKE
jgi:hypothetical protein